MIVGAGIIGLTAALALHRRGRRVTVIDAGQAGHGSTWAGGGIISPVPPWKYPETVQRLVARSQALYPELIATLQAATGIDCEYRRCGLLLVGDVLSGGDSWLSRTGAVRGKAGDFAPALADPERPAALIPDAAQVRNPRLARALALYLRSEGVAILEQTPVARLWLDQGRVRGVETAHGRRAAGATVLAAGAATGRLLEASGLDGLGIAPLKGQIVLFNPGRPLIGQIIADGRQYLIPRADGRILCGSTVEQAGFDCRPTQQACDTLCRAAAAMLPALSDIQPEVQWAGLRPGIEGEVPVIGPYPGSSGLWISAGHFRNGLGMAPAAAEDLAQQINNGL